MQTQPPIPPKIFYGDIELEALAYRRDISPYVIYFEAMRFINGTLDIEKLRFFGSPGMNYDIVWKFGPFEDEWITIYQELTAE